MKLTLIKSVILVLALSITFASCKKDKAETKNSFKYSQKESEIGTVLGLQYGESTISGLFGIQMQFIEKTITIKYVGGSPDSFTGTGDIFLITFLTDKVSEITPGVYNFISSTDPIKTFAVYGGESGILVNYDTSTSTSPSSIEISGGKVKIAKSADEYEFTFDFQTNVNTTIKGYYKGKAVIYANEKKKSVVAGNTVFRHIQ